MRGLRVLLLAAAVLVAPLATPAVAGEQRLGLHSGPGDVASLGSFSSWLGRTPAYASDYVDYKRTWNEIANPLWVLDVWSPWVKASSDRRLVLGVGMLPEAARGQLSAGAYGAFDGHFRRLAQNMVDRGLGGSVIRLGWEANGNWFPWAAAPDPWSWRTFYRRIVQTMRSVPGAAFRFDWNAASSAAGTNLAFADFYPGDDVVDMVGLDNFDLKWTDSTSPPEDRWTFLLDQFNGLRAHKAFADAHGKPLSFPEWGLYAKGDIRGGGGDNPYYIDRMADWFQSNNTAYQTYFNADWGAGNLTSFPMARDRYKARFGAAIQAAPTTTPVPTVTTTPATTTTVAPYSRCTPLPEPYRSQCRALFGS